MKLTKKIQKEVIYEIIAFIVVVLTVSYFWKNNNLLLIALVIEWVVAISLWHKKKDIHFFIAGGIAGPIGEIICIKFGVWSYANPTFLGIPIWLPFLWGFISVLLTRVAETSIKIYK